MKTPSVRAGRGRRTIFRAMAMLFAVQHAAFAATPAPTALPTGAQVTAGQVKVGQQVGTANGGVKLDITQTGQRASVNWNTFDIGASARVNVLQDNAQSVLINRVLSGDPSSIYGTLTATGQIFLLNPAGILFGPSARLDVGGMVASTLKLADDNPVSGRYRFLNDGSAGSVVNKGSLTAAGGGYIALLAPQVINEGVITAKLGTVALGAGDQMSLDLSGDGLINFTVDKGAVDALIANRNLVQADGGQVLIGAKAADSLTAAVVNNDGIVRARGIGVSGGVITLEVGGLLENSGSFDVSGDRGGSVSLHADRMLNSGSILADGNNGGGRIRSLLDHDLLETASALVSARGGEGSIEVEARGGQLFSSGSYRADGLGAGQKGGSVSLAGNSVALMGASVSASGDQGGGSIQVTADSTGNDSPLSNAGKTTVGRGVTLTADAVGSGDGGRVSVWSDRGTVFSGGMSVKGGANGGNGGTMEVSGKADVHFAGTATGFAPRGNAGKLLIDPKNIYIDDNVTGQLEFIDPHPVAGGAFGWNVTSLTSNGTTPTGYVVVTNPADNFGGATRAGAVYLFRQSDQSLISTLYGTHANDAVGSGGWYSAGNTFTSYTDTVVSLTNGNFVVGSPGWNNGIGAATFGNGTTGWGGTPAAVSAANSLVGSLNASNTDSQGSSRPDNVGGSNQIKALSNGNYLVADYAWGSLKGAVAFGSGTSGVSGVISSTNSLVGSTAMTNTSGQYIQYKWGDEIGSNIQLLPNGNYVVVDGAWNKGIGSVTFASGTTGIAGVVGATNSLIGTTSRSDSTGNGNGTDKVGYYYTLLTGSKFIVYSQFWNNGAGAITSFDGTTPVVGVVSSANSLVGGANDYLAGGGISLIPGKNAYVIDSPNWNSGKGAVTLVPFATDVKNVVVATGSLVGSAAGDALGSKGVTVLADGDYVVDSPGWSGSKGAVTLVDGSTGKTTVGQSYSVSAANSIVGAQANDQVGSNGVMELTGNGNYVVLSPYWANGGNAKAGAVTWSSGTTPKVGAVSSANSLVGTSANDLVGEDKYTYYQYGSTTPYTTEGATVTLLANGNYAVASPMWNGNRGAVTWVNGATGVTANASNTISAANSLVGSNASDFVGGLVNPYDVVTNTSNNSTSRVNAVSNGITGLAGGNYVVASSFWKNGSAATAGAVTWSGGAGTPTVGAVTSSNSLVGTNSGDLVGLGRYGQNGITPLLGGYDAGGKQLYSGNYLVTSASWKNGAIAGAGALTWGSGTAALTGTISSANSLLGQATDDVKTNWNITPVYGTGNYLVYNPLWNNGAATSAGAVTWVDGSTGKLGDYAAKGNKNVISAANSLVGTQAGDLVGSYVDFLYNGMDTNYNYFYTGNYLVLSSSWNAGTGAVTWGSGTAGVAGTISTANSIVGNKAGAYLGSYYSVLMNGNYLVGNPNWDNGSAAYAGSLSWVDGSTGRLSDYASQGNLNVVSAANSLVGTHANDMVGQSVTPASWIPPYSTTDNSYFIVNSSWDCNAGALTWVNNAASPITGTVNATNSILGNANGNPWDGAASGNPIYPVLGGAAGTWLASFTGGNGHVLILSQPLPSQPGLSLAGATRFGDAAASNQAIAPDYIANILKSGTSLVLQANNDIYLKSSIDASGGTAGGSLTMQAGRSIALFGSVVTGNRDLTLVANETAANGVSNANRDPGAATISMGSDTFGNLATINAGTGNVSITLAAGADKTNKDGGSISLNSITASKITVVNNGNGNSEVLPDFGTCPTCGADPGFRSTAADVVLNSGALLTAGGSGSAVTLAAAGKFTNSSGIANGDIVLTDPSARWLIYSASPATDTFGGLISGDSALWGRTYANYPTVAESGDRYLFNTTNAVTLTTTSASKSYGATPSLANNYTLSFVAAAKGSTYGGVYLDPTLGEVWSAAPTITATGVAATTAAGNSSTVTASGGTLNTGFSRTFTNSGALTVTKAPLTLTANNQAKTFGSALTFAGTEFTPTGLQNSETVGHVTLTSTGAGSSAAVGNYPIVISSATGGTFAAGNYTISYANGSLAVNPLSLTLITGSIVGNPTKVYDGTNTATLAGSNYTLAGFVNGNSASITKTVGTYDSANAGTRIVTVSLAPSDFTAGSGTSLSNYTLPTSLTGSGTIGKAPLTLSVDNKTRLYGDANPTLTGTFTGFKHNETLATSGVSGSALLATDATANTPVGTAAITAALGSLAAGNYDFTTFNSGTLTIGKAHLTFTTDNLSRLYGAANPTFTGTISGFKNEETLATSGVTGSPALASSAAATTAVGTVPITAAQGTLAAGNYDFTTFNNGTLTIGKAPLTLTASNLSKTYGNALTFTGNEFTPTGLQNSETVGHVALASTGAGSAAAAGNYAITISSATGGTFAAGNYTITYTNGSLAVNPASLTVVTGSIVGNPTKSYDGTDLATLTGSNYSLAGFVNGDSASITKTVGSYDSANAGTRTVTVTLAASDFSPAGETSLGNYVLPTSVTGSGTIGKAHLSVSADNQTRLYGDANPTLTAAISGFVHSETLATSGVSGSAQVTTAATATTGAGTAVIAAAKGSLAAGNYDFTTFNNGTLTIGKAPLSITADNKSKVYGASDPTLTASYSGFKNNEDSTVVSNLSLATATGSQATAGTHPIAPSGGTAANYQITLQNGTLSVDKAPLTVTADDKAKVYGAADPQLTASFQGLKYEDNASAVSGLTLATATGAAATAGTHAITAANGTAANYAISYQPGTLAVAKAQLAIAADSKGKVYGNPDPQLTASYLGLKYADDASAVSGLSLSTVTGAAATAGTHAITAANGAALNYDISYQPGTLSVDKAQLAIAADNKGKVYGAADPQLTASYQGFKYEDDSSAVSGLTLTTATGASATAGTHAITGANGTAANYAISYQPGTLTVDKAQLAVTADNKAKVYGAADPQLTASYQGFKYEDDSSAVSGLTLNTATGAAATAGTHAITGANGTAANYAVSYQPGTLTVDKAALTVTADNKAKVYGAADPQLTASYQGLKYEDNASAVSGLTLNTATGAAATAGTHAITAASGTAANYAISYQPGTLSVAKAQLAIAAENKSKVYGAADPQLTANYLGFKYADDASAVSGLTLNTATGASATAGSHAITAGGATAANYDISFQPGTLSVAKAQLSITADGKGKVYGAADPQLTASYQGFKYEDDSSAVTGLTLTTVTGAAAAAGTHAITGANGTAANYAISYQPGTLTVAKAQLAIAADSKGKVYGAADPQLTASYLGLKYADDASAVSGLSLSTVTGAAATAGTHPITAAGGTALNYDISYQPGTLSVAKAPLAITADDKSKVYGAADPQLTASYQGLKYADDASAVNGLTLATVTGPSATAGTHTITAANGTALNYDISWQPGTLTVAKAPLTVTADDKGKVYGAPDPQLTASYQGFKYEDDTSVVSGVTLNTVTGIVATAGTHPITAGGGRASNYAISYRTGTLTVDRAPLSIAADDQAKVYGAADPQLTASYQGFQYADDPSVVTGLTLATATGAAATAGTHTITAAEGTAANYAISYRPGTLSVARAQLAIAANDQAKVYGAADPQLTATYLGLKYADDASAVSGLTLATATGAAATAGTHVITAGGGTAANYDLSFRPGTLNVAKAQLAIAADNKAKVYGATDPQLTATYTGLKYADDASAVSGLTLDTVTGAAATAGTHAITAANGTAANYAISYQPGTLTVDRAQLLIAADNKGKVYGAADPQLTANYQGFKYADDASAVNGLTLTTVTGAAATAGTHAIAAANGTAANYAISYQPGTLTVDKAQLAIAADNKGKVYGALDPQLTASYQGFQYADDASAVSGLTLTTETGASATAGTHAIAAANGTAANYAISYQPGTLTVDRALLSITAEGKGKVYGALDPQLTASYQGFKYEDNAQAVSGLTLTTATGAAATAGTHAITAANGTAANYAISYQPGTLTVDKAQLAITADDKGKVYGAADPQLTAIYQGFKYADDASAVSGLTLNTATGAAATAGTHAITAANGTAANYAISYQPGTLTVEKAQLAITADDKGKVYGAADPQLTASYRGFQYADDVSAVSGLTLTTETGASATAGTHAITAANGTAANYAISYQPGTLTVDRAPLTIGADNKGKVYGAADPQLTASYQGFQYADDSSAVSGLTLNTATGAAATAGTHTITAADGTAANYAITYQPGTLTVDRAPLTISADNKGKVYGAADPQLTASYQGFQYGDDALAVSGLALNTATGAAATAGTHPITAGSGTALNYDISYRPGTLTVERAPLTVTADDQGKVYGAADPQLTASYTGLKYADTPSVVSNLQLDTVTGKNATAGTHAITASGGTADNYLITTGNGTLTVEKATLTVTADDKSRMQGLENPPLTVSYGGFQYDDNADLLAAKPVAATSALQASAPDKYGIVAAGGQGANYAFRYVDGVLTVTPAPVQDAGTVMVVKNTVDNKQTYQQPQGSSTGTGSTGTALITLSADSSALSVTPVAPTPSLPGSTQAVSAPIRLSVGGESKGSMVVTEQDGGLTLSVAPGSGTSATDNIAPSKGALTIYTVGSDGAKSEGNFAVSSGSGSLSIAPSTESAAATPKSQPETGDGGKAATFSITTAEGNVLEFSVSQSGDTMKIQPINEAARGALGGLDKKLVTAAGMLAGQEKLGVGAEQVGAVMIYDK